MKRGTLLLLFMYTCAAQSAHNVLLVIADDFGTDSCRLYNTNSSVTLASMPNLTALARSGVQFNRAYANPVCSPTRACILTGRHGFRTGVGTAIAGPSTATLSAGEWTLPEAFGSNGSAAYQLAQFGKWHLAAGPNTPATVGGWPHFSGSLAGAIANYTNWTKTVNGTSTAGNTNYATTDVVNEAMAWIQARGTSPWFAWVAFNAPHSPFHKPPNHLHSYDGLSGTQANINADPESYYNAAIEALDTELGRLLTVVDRRNTHIIFLGDNGTPAQVLHSPVPANRGKDTLYEGGIRVPLIIAGPAVAQTNRTEQALVHAVDLFSTILEMVGFSISGSVPANVIVDSKSVFPVLRGESGGNGYVYAERFDTNSVSPGEGRSLRNDRYKLIQFTAGQEEFYDLQVDPWESTDLLNGAMNEEQTGNYYHLLMRLGLYQDEVVAPEITSWRLTGTNLSLTVPRDPTLTYALWHSSDALDELSWRPAAAVVMTDNSTVTLTHTTGTNLQGYYRVSAQR